MVDDTPKYWHDPEDEIETYDNTSALMPVEQNPLPTVEEATCIVAESDVTQENKGFLGALLEMNKVADVLMKIDNEEQKERRRNVLSLLCENFINNRLQNNMLAEKVKRALLVRVLDNIENMDLELATRTIIDLHEVLNADSQNAIGNVTGTSPISQGSGVNIINNITSAAEGASITNQTMNVGQNASKELSGLRNALHDFNSTGLVLPTKDSIKK